MTATLVSTTSGQDPRPWGERARRGFEQWSGTKDFESQAACVGDNRFIQRELPERVVVELIDICQTCPVMQRCFLWAQAQTQPVGFVVAGGRRWKAWNTCSFCGRRVRGTDRCGQHLNIGEPIGTISADGIGREYRIVADDH